MALTIPPPPEPMPKSHLPEGGDPRTDAAYEAWRDGLLARWSERLVTRFFHTADLHDLMPAWHFDEELCERLGGRQPLLPRMHYTHRLRWLGVELKLRRKATERAALAILESVDTNEAELP